MLLGRDELSPHSQASSARSKSNVLEILRSLRGRIISGDKLIEAFDIEELDRAARDSVARAVSQHSGIVAGAVQFVVIWPTGIIRSQPMAVLAV